MKILKWCRENLKDFLKPFNIVTLVLAVLPYSAKLLAIPAIHFSMNETTVLEICWGLFGLLYIINHINQKNKSESKIQVLQSHIDSIESEIIVISEIMQYRAGRIWEVFDGNVIWQGNKPITYNANKEFEDEKIYIKNKLIERFGDKMTAIQIEQMINHLYPGNK